MSSLACAWPSQWFSESQTHIISSPANGNRSALLGWFSALSAPGSVPMSPAMPLATQAFVQSEASLTGSPTPVASFAFASSRLFPSLLYVSDANCAALFPLALALPEEEQVLLPSQFWELDTA